MSIFSTERGLKRSEIKEKLKYWYDINMQTANTIPAEDRLKWEALLKKFIQMQYAALLTIFEMEDE
tara:strand:- start:149 stop:346 length:198 start_codon:yes stop_codon:yes gene_type:complete